MNRIPPRLLHRLNREDRYSVLDRIKYYQRGNQFILPILDGLDNLIPCHPFYRRPIKLLVTHGFLTLGTLAFFPPANTVPPIAIPIVFCASFCVAYSLSAMRII